MPPWSVSASASMPPALVASISRLMRDWPSSRLYSEWTCRWVKSAATASHPPRLSVSSSGFPLPFSRTYRFIPWG